MLNWEAPFANYLEITQMQTQVQTGEDFADVCVGEWLHCRILMTELRQVHGYQINEMPVFQTRAMNERGWSEFSALNQAGGLIETEPAQMNQPLRNVQST